MSWRKSTRWARAETAIGFGAVSLGYAVVELARSIFTRIEECSVLLLGAGEIATSVARALSERGARRLTIANRSAARAAHFLAEFPQADRVEFSERLAAIPDTDVVVATTAAEEPVLLRRDLESLGRRRSGRPLLLVDLGVPRNIDPEVGRLETVFLHNLDALDHLIQQNLRRRREEVPRVEAIIEEELARFLVWHRSLAAEPLIGQLQRQAEKIRRGEVEQVLRRFPAETHEELERLTRSLVKKLLHHPSTRLRAAEESDLARLDLVRDLFQLNPEEPEK